jgi:hypothetical protein
MTSLNTKYTGTLDEARASLDGIRKAADDAAGDAAKAWGENYQVTVGYFHKIREGWWNLVEFFASHPISIAGISQGVTEKLFGKKKDESKDGATSAEDIIAKGNAAAANSTETEEARVKRIDQEKKTAEEVLKTRTDLYAKLDEAENKHQEAQMDEKERLNKLQFDASGLEDQMQFYSGDNRIAAEAKLLGIKTEILSVQKDIRSEEEQLAGKAESLMKRDRDLREMSMTPEQKRDASKGRQADLEKQLADEKDPGKRLDIQAKIMDEFEKQSSLGKKSMHSLSVGDLYAKNDKNGGRADPAHEQVDVLKRVELLLKDIKNKPGGMVK